MDDYFMNLAAEAANDGMTKNAGGPFGALVVKDNKVIAIAHNEVTSTNDPTAHAEVLAIRRACKELGSFQLDECTIYATCEPCPMCLGAIYWARPKKVVYSSTREDAANIQFDDQFIYDEIAKNISDRKIEFIKIDSLQSQNLFEDWKNKSDKSEY
jgi:guanine deaminase